jgi:uncharacterized membrane protein YkoI
MSRAMIIFSVAAAFTSTSAFAQPGSDRPNDASRAPAAGVPLAAAIATAEQHVTGKAVRAEYETQKNGQWVYDIEVMAGSKVFDVKIDANKGTVIASAEDKVDTDDENDKAD